MEQKFIDLFDRYTHGGMNRRDFLERLSLMAGSAAAATALLPALENNYAMAQVVPENDPAIKAERLEIAPGIKGYLARPSAEGSYAAVLVIHENRGLNPHIEDVTRRMAKDGFIAFGGDYLTAMGGTPQDADKARDMIGQLTPEQSLTFSQAAIAALAKLPWSNGKVGAVGFCWGGGQVNALAASGDPNLKAGVAYYGRQAPAADVPKIAAAVMLHYAENDERINAGIAEYEAALKANGKAFELHMYPGAQHAFNNDTNAARYNKEAADLAWGRTVEFFRKHLA
jgi:carboxymethylenebutenolidase